MKLHSKLFFAFLGLAGCGSFLDLDWTPSDKEIAPSDLLPSDVIDADSAVATGSSASGGPGGAGVGATGAASATTAASGGACVLAGDCPGSDHGCVVRACVAGACTTSIALAGMPCGKDLICDGQGGCVECLDDAQCSSGVCRSSHCETCTDHVMDGRETDKDCGGPDCQACKDGKHCLVPSDCKEGHCSDGVCQHHEGGGG